MGNNKDKRKGNKKRKFINLGAGITGAFANFLIVSLIIKTIMTIWSNVPFFDELQQLSKKDLISALHKTFQNIEMTRAFPNSFYSGL
jgi:hypothetical protein